MKKKRIIFRADGNLIAGYGHVIRGLSLATMLKNKYHTVFVIQEPDIFLQKQIKETCAKLITLPFTKNLSAESKHLSKNILDANDIVVLDGYGYGINYQKEIKKGCFKLICIDDIYDHDFVADVIINHGEGIKRNDYSAERFSAIYLGTRYSILRKSFLKKPLSPELYNITKHKAFISLGGTDQQNYTQKALKICLRNSTIKEINIVVGSFYPYLDKLQHMADSNKKVKIKVHRNLSEQNISSMMRMSTVAICSASTLSYEYSSVGGLLFLYQTVLNQKKIYSFMIKSEIAYPVASFDIVLASFKDKSICENYFTNRRQYFAGDTAKNLISIFDRLERERGCHIRPAISSDVHTYFKWVNDPEVRANSVNIEPVNFDGHTKWFVSKLKDKNASLYIVEKNRVPLGQVRFDRGNNESEIDYSVGKSFRGKGYGDVLLKKAIQEHLIKFPKHKIIAKVKMSNIASNRVFEKLGFKKNGVGMLGGIKYVRYVLPAAN
ncbi:MAG: UDP-2,4-diacetamido-2,4,6-trideoxy-beta-L-altropyranose hydrolase [Bacteroidetes bacterium]|nr:UDP-2,4-diacetamido-2,4,6-trideoxy-beta-L-altropyranose hydrolase [Bacteroidota bacterium]